MLQRYKYWGLCMAGGLCASASLAQQRPHIILIVTDQQRADALGCMGDSAVISPNIDRLAHDGFLFRHAYTAAPSSTPARASLLTGQSPWRHGMLGYGRMAEHYDYEMPQMLRKLGYHTLGIRSVRCVASRPPCLTRAGVWKIRISSAIIASGLPLKPLD